MNDNGLYVAYAPIEQKPGFESIEGFESPTAEKRTTSGPEILGLEPGCVCAVHHDAST